MTTRDPSRPGKPQEKPNSDAAKDRLAAALRENLKRRKAQERARDVKTEPKSEEGR
ncbi:MAG: hypothetical protein AB7I36_05695 [Rhodospirillaceae bacterium]